MYKKTKEAAEGDKDIELKGVYICPVCGYTVEGKIPEYCSVCGVKAEVFKKF